MENNVGMMEMTERKKSRKKGRGKEKKEEGKIEKYGLAISLLRITEIG